MPSSGIAIVPSDLKSEFLDGLHPSHRKTILSAATLRRFSANSVATNQGHPADYFFLLTNGSARYFFVTDDGKKLLLGWLGPGDAFGGRTVLSSPSSYLVSTEMTTDSSILWAQGKADAAIRLAELWNEIARTYDVDILCGYPLESLRCEEDSYTFRRICEEHSAVDFR